MKQRFGYEAFDGLTLLPSAFVNKGYRCWLLREEQYEHLALSSSPLLDQ